MTTCQVYVGSRACGQPATVLVDDLIASALVPVCAEHNDQLRAPRDYQWEAAEYDRLAARLADGPPADRRAAAYWRRRAQLAREEGR